MLKLYKWLGKDRMPCHGGQGRWPVLGEWWEVLGEIAPCHRGLHLCRKEDLPHWIGHTLWQAEHEGELIESDNKIVVRKARLIRQLKWGKTEQVEFACRAAERVLPIFEKVYPTDVRPRKAIEVARADNNTDAAYTAGAAAYAAAHAAAAAYAAAHAARAAAYAATAAHAAADAYAAADAHAAAYAATAAAHAADAAAAAAYAATDAADVAAGAADAADAARAAELKAQAWDILNLTGEMQCGS